VTRASEKAVRGSDGGRQVGDVTVDAGPFIDVSTLLCSLCSIFVSLSFFYSILTVK
jgi:hypothetical protein